MKKLSLLVGTLGGAMAGYLFSNKKLRDQLAEAKDPEEAAKILGAHLQRDGKKLGKQLQDFVGSDEIQGNITKAKTFTTKKVDEAKREMKALVSEGKTRATKTVKKTASKAKKTVSKAKSTAKRTAKKAVSSARRTGKKVKVKVRSVTK